MVLRMFIKEPTLYLFDRKMIAPRSHSEMSNGEECEWEIKII